MPWPTMNSFPPKPFLCETEPGCQALKGYGFFASAELRLRMTAEGP